MELFPIFSSPLGFKEKHETDAKNAARKV